MKNNTERKVFYIVYRNRYNEVKPYAVEVLSSFEGRFDALDIIAEKIKTFKSDRICSHHLDFEAAVKAAAKIQINFLVTQRDGAIKLTESEYRRRYNNKNSTEICFTGFKANRKKELVKTAKDFGFFIRPSVTENLSILVCGSNAGPAKLKKAEAAGVKVLTEDEWLALIA